VSLLFGGIAMKVEQIMNREVRRCRPHDSLNQAAQIMWDTCLWRISTQAAIGV
jgi:predicted transcriptional regulator